MLQAESINKKYDSTQILFDIDLRLEKGKVHGLIGENGAGKTTLIKCLSGIYKPDGGKVLCEDMEVYDNPPAKSKIAYVSDSQEIMGMYSVKGLVKLYDKMFESFSTERFKELNEQFGLGMSKYLAELSKGQKMSLAFMLAIASNAEYLIMDEPLSGLDAVRQKLVLDTLIYEVETRNIGVLLSSHNLGGMEKLCDEITMLRGGRVVLQNTVGEMNENYQCWQMIAEDVTMELLRKEKGMLEIVRESGSIAFAVTEGDCGENREMLANCGAKGIEQRTLHLEKLFLILNSKEEAE